MSVAGLVMAAIAMALRAPWPRERAAIGQMVVVGLLLQAAQFVGIFLALQHTGTITALASRSLGRLLITSPFSRRSLTKRQ
jgi:drug/metabolite transporter (DMT)-like permease